MILDKQTELAIQQLKALLEVFAYSDVSIDIGQIILSLIKADDCAVGQEYKVNLDMVDDESLRALVLILLCLLSTELTVANLFSCKFISDLKQQHYSF
ncbi:hypothetical protein RI845_13615 [Thalassotalea nanhaiensis]|uniref:Uncharacterized protein n=1 Tax=Thalassotalea nanhaiensis TaxID=3065648 RepID=A0ABY9TGJ2_9GAMM|nr:hypothetical protein RI845_13615 [Colwelliaceae bacterium SQ345]